MTCACGHHSKAHHAPSVKKGTPIPMHRPMFALTGHLTCQSVDQMKVALSLLPDHIHLSRAEPGCLRFDMWQDEDPMVWHLSELFLDADAFDAHAARTAASDWGRASTDIDRDFHDWNIKPVIRPETRDDTDAVDALLRQTFGGDAEADLVRDLRRNGDLALSLVADAAGMVLGHIALSHLQAEQPALALAPLAVTTKAQRLGIGAALIHQAVLWAEESAVVVLGDPGYYGPLGFKPADLVGPYAGPHLQMIGNLPEGSAIAYAPAFANL